MKLLAGAVSIVVIIAVIFNAFIHWLERSPPLQPEYQEKKLLSFLKPTQKMPEPMEAALPLLPGIAEIEQKRPQIQAAMRSFFGASTVEEKLTFSRDPDRVRPLMKDYFLRHPWHPQTVIALGNCLSVEEKGHRLGYVQVMFAQGEPTSVIVEEMTDGQFCADWESLIRYSEMDWGDFLSQKPKKPTLMRVIASQVRSSPDTGYDWLEIKSPGHEEVLQAYFDRRAPDLQPLLEQLQLGDWKNVPLTLRVCYSESNKAKADAVCIIGIEGKGWLILTKRRS